MLSGVVVQMRRGICPGRARGPPARVASDAEVLRAQRFELENLRAADQRPVDREERVFRRRAEQADGAAFHIGQQRVLLRAVEAVDFVDEEDRARVRVETLAVFGAGDDAPDVARRCSRRR